MAEKYIYNKDISVDDMSDAELDAAFAAMIKQHAAETSKPATQHQTTVVDNITATLDSQEAMNRSFTEWRSILAAECGVYNTKYGFLAKNYDEIVYKYIGRDDTDAALIAKHNLTAILRYKYFKKESDEIDKQIDKIIDNFCKHIYNNICYMTINCDDKMRGSLRRDTIPMSAVAFANGVYDFKENKWLLKYDRITIPTIRNALILYQKYIIMWHFNYDFEPYDFSIEDVSFEDFISIMRGIEPDKSNLAWQLFFNMTHDSGHKPSLRRQQHFAEILGYTIATPFIQSFVILVGQGHNGKNSIFDGAFTNFVIPTPVQESLENIENDKFIGGTLKGSCQNISLETKPGVYKSSDQLKKLTGSQEFTIEEKGKTKTTIPMNCKFIFSANNQNNLKFSDRTHGFERRCNLFEIYYQWDKNHEYLKASKDYYKTEFFVNDISNDWNNNRLFVYLGMYGIKYATKNFTKEFNFTFNEWSEAYSDKDAEIEDFFKDELTATELFDYWNDFRLNVSNSVHQNAFMIENSDTKMGASKLHVSPEVQNTYNFTTWEELAAEFKVCETLTGYDSDGNEIHAVEVKGITFLRDHDIYVSLEYLRALMKIKHPYSIKDNALTFNDSFRKALGIARTPNLALNKAYVRVRLKGANRLEFLNEI